MRPVFRSVYVQVTETAVYKDGPEFDVHVADLVDGEKMETVDHINAIIADLRKARDLIKR